MRTAWCIDVSGSMGSEAVRRAVGVPLGRGEPEDPVVFFDSAVLARTTVDGLRRRGAILSHGRGGTDFEEVFATLPELGVERCVVVTDGYMMSMDEMRAFGIEFEVLED